MRFSCTWSITRRITADSLPTFSIRSPPSRRSQICRCFCATSRWTWTDLADPERRKQAMPVLSRGSLKIDYNDDGQGQPVVLIHSSVSANRQWRPLTEILKDRYRVLALNLFGYGE